MKLVQDTWAQIAGPIWAKNRKIDHLWAGSGKTKKGVDLKFGSLVALTIAHNIPKNQPDRIKTMAYRILGRHQI